jgi:integrase
MKHFPGLYRRKSGLYGFARQENGVRSFTSLKTHDLGEAIRRARDLAGPQLDPSNAEVADWIERFIAHKLAMNRYSAASAESKRYILRKFGRFVGCPPANVTRVMVQSFYESLRDDKLSDDTAASYLSTVRAFFRWCVEFQKLCRENPAAGLHLARISPRARRDFCTPAQVQKLISECPREDLKFVLYCGFHAGMRKQEIIEARAFWFDVPNRQIHLRKHEGIQFKDREERSLPMTDEFAEFLAGYGMRDPYMLHPEVVKGKSIYRYDFEHYFRAYADSHDLPWLTTHIMRHTFASLLSSSGESIFNIAVWLGDDVRVVQKHYAKLLPVKRDLGAAFRVTAM